jgi:hypothetical protein
MTEDADTLVAQCPKNRFYGLAEKQIRIEIAHPALVGHLSEQVTSPKRCQGPAKLRIRIEGHSGLVHLWTIPTTVHLWLDILKCRQADRHHIVPTNLKNSLLRFFIET